MQYRLYKRYLNDNISINDIKTIAKKSSSWHHLLLERSRWPTLLRVHWDNKQNNACLSALVSGGHYNNANNTAIIDRSYKFDNHGELKREMTPKAGASSHEVKRGWNSFVCDALGGEGGGSRGEEALEQTCSPTQVQGLHSRNNSTNNILTRKTREKSNQSLQKPISY